MNFQHINNYCSWVHYAVMASLFDIDKNHFFQGQIGEADQWFQKAIKLDEKEANSYIHYGEWFKIHHARIGDSGFYLVGRQITCSYTYNNVKSSYTYNKFFIIKNKIDRRSELFRRMNISVFQLNF